MTPVFLIDTNVWSGLVVGNSDEQRQVQLGLRRLRQTYSGATWATSELCVAECKVYARQQKDNAVASALESRFHELFTTMGTMLVPVSSRVLDRAASLRAERNRRVKGSQMPSPKGGKFGMPDAIVAASCFEFNPIAVLVTQNVADFHYHAEGQSVTVGDLVVEKLF